MALVNNPDNISHRDATTSGCSVSLLPQHLLPSLLGGTFCKRYHTQELCVPQMGVLIQKQKLGSRPVELYFQSKWASELERVFLLLLQ